MTLRVLVVEDEALVAMALEDLLADAGCAVVGPVGAVPQAVALVEGGAEIDCALLDVNLRGVHVYPVAEVLERRGVPFAFTSSYGKDGIDPRFAGRPVLPKPLNPALLSTFLATLRPRTK